MKQNKVVALLVVFALLLSVAANVFAQDDALVVWADGERVAIIQAFAAQFEEEFGVAVDVQQYGLGDARDQLLVAGPVGEGPDILIQPHDVLGQLVSNGAIIPLDLEAEGLTDQFVQGGLNLFTFNGELYGMPYGFDNIALIRNVDLVPEAPQTWEEVTEISRELQESGAAQYGFLVQTGDTYHHFPIISAFGGYIFGLNEDGSYNTADVGLNSEGGLAAAQWMADMYAEGLMTTDTDDDVVKELFSTGDLAMWVTGPWWGDFISETGINYSIDPLPGSEVGLEQGLPFAGGQGFVVSAFSDNQLLALEFLYGYLATDEAMQALFDDAGRIPAWVDVDTSANPNLAGFAAAGENAVPMPAIPEMSAVWGASNSALTSISQGADPEEAMNSAVTQINNAINSLQAFQEIYDSEGVDKVYVAAGSFQSQAGCPADWSPQCLDTRLTDEDGDGVYTFTVELESGDYAFKVTVNGAWDEQYGDGGAGGADVAFTVMEPSEVTISFDSASGIPSVE